MNRVALWTGSDSDGARCERVLSMQSTAGLPPAFFEDARLRARLS